jgi:hypothetical protein
MKTTIFALCAVFMAFGLTAFGELSKEKGARAIVFFNYALNDNPNESSYETVSSWSYSTSPLSCPSGSRATCRVSINTTMIPSYDPSNPEVSFVNWLTSQDGDPGEYASAVAAVLALGTEKP